MATTKIKASTPPVPASDEAAAEAEPAPPATGYVTIERADESACVDAKSVPELEVQGWQLAN